MVISDSKTFGEALKKRRKELGYTQRYISEFTGFIIEYYPPTC
jgi:transcriptional regulator with XRE-family HTH domain